MFQGSKRDHWRVLLWGHVPHDRIWSPTEAQRPALGFPAESPLVTGSRPAYPGEALGLPESGPGSLAPMGRRVAALLIDWLIAYGLALLFLGLGVIKIELLSTVILVIWFLLGLLSVRLFGFTPGQLTLGLGVVSVAGGGTAGIGRLAVRGLLLALVVPALFTDWDGRGIHDRATGTAVVRR